MTAPLYEVLTLKSKRLNESTNEQHNVETNERINLPSMDLVSNRDNNLFLRGIRSHDEFLLDFDECILHCVLVVSREERDISVKYPV